MRVKISGIFQYYTATECILKECAGVVNRCTGASFSRKYRSIAIDRRRKNQRTHAAARKRNLTGSRSRKNTANNTPDVQKYGEAATENGTAYSTDGTPYKLANRSEPVHNTANNSSRGQPAHKPPPVSHEQPEQSA